MTCEPSHAQPSPTWLKSSLFRTLDEWMLFRTSTPVSRQPRDRYVSGSEVLYSTFGRRRRGQSGQPDYRSVPTMVFASTNHQFACRRRATSWRGRPGLGLGVDLDLD